MLGSNIYGRGTQGTAAIVGTNWNQIHPSLLPDSQKRLTLQPFHIIIIVYSSKFDQNTGLTSFELLRMGRLQVAVRIAQLMHVLKGSKYKQVQSANGLVCLLSLFQCL